MATTATIYRLTVSLSDVDRGVYEELAFRVACHPSEGNERLVTRILAYLLNYDERLEFGRGLSDADEPALWRHDLTGLLEHWIDVGTPSAERIHLASKKAQKVSIVCHKTEAGLSREFTKKKLFKAEDIRVTLLEPGFIKELANALDRTSEWSVVRTDDELTVTLGELTVSSTVRDIALTDLDA